MYNKHLSSVLLAGIVLLNGCGGKFDFSKGEVKYSIPYDLPQEEKAQGKEAPATPNLPPVNPP